MAVAVIGFADALLDGLRAAGWPEGEGGTSGTLGFGKGGGVEEERASGCVSSDAWERRAAWSETMKVRERR